MAGRLHDRAPWRLEGDVSFLNHGAFGACPEPVLEAQRAWRERMERQPVRFFARELEAELDAARQEVAIFLNADADGLAFVPNATAGVSTVLSSLRFQPGDELLACDHEYNATLNALRAAAARDGATVVLAKVPFPVADAGQVVQAYLDAATPRTRLALVSQVTSPTALVMPVVAIVRELERRGIDTLVDGAHAPGMVPCDVRSLNAAYWTGNGHKWLCAPKGSGLLHVRADLRAQIRPLADLARGEQRAQRPVRVPARLRLAGHPGPVAVADAARRDPVRRGPPRGRLGRTHGGEPRDGPGRPGPPVQRPRDPRPGARRDARCHGLGPAGGHRRDRRGRRAAPGGPAGGGRDRGAGAPVPGPRGARRRGGGRPRDPPVSAQRYNRSDEYVWLADRVAARVKAARSPRSILGRLRRG